MARTQRRTLVIVADVHNPHDNVDLTEQRWAKLMETQLRNIISATSMPAGLGVVVRHAEWDGTVTSVNTDTGVQEVTAIEGA